MPRGTWRTDGRRFEMTSWFDRLRDSLESVGKSAHRFSKVANRKVDLWDARRTLENCYERLGKICASRFIDRDERAVDRSEELVARCLDDVRAARAKVEELERLLDPAAEESAEVEIDPTERGDAESTGPGDGLPA